MSMMEASHNEKYLGQVVPFSFLSRFLALSYAVSLIGAACTLELINRRTSRKGHYNHLLLLGAAISMGGIAIWCMHYIGNRAITLLDGEPELQIAYSTGTTALSFFVPIVVLLVAFFVITTTNPIRWWRISLSGTLSGCAICGMHYLGNASISNYQCSYAVPNVVGAAIIAAAASTVALALFFVFRAAWTNSWWKRIGCAIVLAGAVSGMHWCAAVGTSYRLLHANPASGHSSRDTTVIVVACLSVGACLVMAGTAIYSARIRKRYASKAQRITLAAAVFDRQGRILVTPDGLLPSEEITSTFLQRTQDDVFSTAHPLFNWVFQASRNWPSITDLVEKMASHLGHLPHNGRKTSMGIELEGEDENAVDNYDTIFRERFCLAAAGLAGKMNESLTDAGILWDEIFITGGGWTRYECSDDAKRTRSQSNTKDDMQQGREDTVEKGLACRTDHGQGCLMFLVRSVESSRAVGKLEAAGYCFAELHQVAHIIGSSMQIRGGNLEERLRAMVSYPQGTMLEPGVHVGLFAVRARLDRFGFDVLARKQARNLLPSVKMPLARLGHSHLDLLRRLDGLSLSSLLERLEHRGDIGQQDAKFASLLHDATRNLRTTFYDPIFDDATLVSKVVQVPCRSSAQSSRPATCSLVTLSLMIPIHAGVSPPKCEFMPLQFFKTQQLVYKNSPHQAVFARSVHRELAPLLNSMPSASSMAPIFAGHRRYSIPIIPSTLKPSFRRLARPATSSTARHRHEGSESLVSASREQMTFTPSNNNSAASMQQYNTNGGGRESPSHSSPGLKSPYEEMRVSPAKHSRRQQQQHHQQLSPFGGIMVSQEITVDVEEANMPTIMMPPETYKAGHHPPRSPTSLATPRRKSAGTVSVEEDSLTIDGKAVTNHGGGIMMTPSFDQAYEMKEVSPVLGLGLSRVEVKKEGDVTTFVDELLASCTDASRRMS
ncbi:hypothetical protein QBC46DRAFT_358017 [Diplogelasinospora grovesii]|uniref:MHYT domain-containing protein n=1 Tax=Diplogelasinospora grovesii TaxID=303347 RepID=A0AAN6N0Q0_9PEZI|nr:hypothetical protein QBC46DRAFT_358017 [Diplogelasinospora grovesii]